MTRRGRRLSERASRAREALRLEARLFRRLFAYTRPYRGRLVSSWIATLGYATAGALIVSQVKPIFDEALIQGLNVGRLSLTILVLYVVKGASSYLSTTLVADAGQRAVSDLRNALYEHILKQSFAFLGRRTTGSLMSHVTTDVEKIQAAVSELAGDLLKEGLTILGLLAVLFYMDWRLAILVARGHAAGARPAAAARAAAAHLERDVAAALEGHLGDPAGDDLGLPRGEGVRDGGLRDRPLPPRERAAAGRQHAHHPHHGDPAAADGGGGRARADRRSLLRQLVDPRRPPHDRAPSSRS